VILRFVLNNQVRFFAATFQQIFFRGRVVWGSPTKILLLSLFVGNVRYCCPVIRFRRGLSAIRYRHGVARMVFGRGQNVLILGQCWRVENGSRKGCEPDEENDENLKFHTRFVDLGIRVAHSNQRTNAPR